MKREAKSTEDQILECIEYDKETGLFRWKRTGRGRVKQGWWQGTLAFNGYIRIQFMKKQYGAHRIAWLLTYGEWPSDQIDHINGIRTDNRIANLRSVNGLENNKNQRKTEKNTSGCVGVSLDSRTNSWAAYVSVENRKRHLGRFKNFSDAVRAREIANTELGFHPNHGRRS